MYVFNELTKTNKQPNSIIITLGTYIPNYVNFLVVNFQLNKYDYDIVLKYLWTISSKLISGYHEICTTKFIKNDAEIDTIVEYIFADSYDSIIEDPYAAIKNYILCTSNVPDTVFYSFESDVQQRTMYVLEHFLFDMLKMSETLKLPLNAYNLYKSMGKDAWLIHT